MRQLVAVCAIGLVMAAAAAAQLPDMTATKAGFDALDQGRYLKADHLLRAAGRNTDGSVRDEAAFQSWDQVHPMLTGEVPVGGLRPPKETPAASKPADRAAMAAATPHDAIAEIVKRARDTNVVVLNEAHDSPRDRAFALEVARALRPIGYGYLAAEAFANPYKDHRSPSPIDQLSQDGFVRLWTGHYTKDPVFAGYVREAMRIGYRPIVYEQTEAQAGTATDRHDSIATREEAEAQNLQTFLRSHPSAKLLIHVGYSHVAEAPIGSGDRRSEWMAARLKRETGIDSLTIDQTGITDTARSQARLYDAAAARITRPSVFMTGDRPLVLGQYAGAVDLQVIHPRRSYRNGRPAWLAALGGRPVAIPPALLPAKGERLVQAFAADAPADAVPLDQVLVAAGKPVPMLMVPPGPYRLATQDPE